MNQDDSGDGSHVQEGFEWQPKKEGLIYPGNDSERIKPNWQMEFQRNCRCKEAGWGEEKVTTAERSMLRHSS